MSVVYVYDETSSRVLPEHVCLNNYYYAIFQVKGKVYNSVEHYYQAHKFNNTEDFERIMRTGSAAEAQKLAHEIGYDRENWSRVKDEVMWTALNAKFRQNEELRRVLLGTGDERLVEDSLSDRYWGGVLEGSLNKLGEMLMKLREILKNEERDI